VLDLLANAIVSGLLLGGFYAAVTVGVSISFGLLDIVNIAHPAFVMLGSFLAYSANAALGLDPIVAGFLLAPAFYGLGAVVYRLYHASFERRGRDSLRGLAFFFGLMFITEVALVLIFGVDYRLVDTPYSTLTLRLGGIGIPLRLLVPFIASAAMIAALQLMLDLSFLGRAIKAVAQDQLALRLMAADPVRVKTVAFAISIATASLAGAFLIVIAPVEPSLGRDYIGRVFAICVLGGMGSLPGTAAAGLILGVAESLTATFYGPSWSPAIAFGLLLLVLAVRPSGLLGR
jgi:branched-chain amino acid transport system permease protein